jgi:DNA-binding IclR family transcriptional regulator
MPKINSKSANPLSSVQKTCRILAALSDPARARLTDIAETAQLDVSTTLRILKELESENFIERDPESKHYSLGPQAYVMHHAMVARMDIRAAARPSLIRLAKKFGDTAILSIPMGWESVCGDLCFGDYPIRANYLDVGSRRPLGVGAGSLALLAALPTAEQLAVLPQVQEQLVKRYPDYSAQRLAQETARARQLGHVMLLDVVVDRMGGVGVAVCAPGGKPMAALSIAALSERISGRELDLAHALKEEARLIEKAWLP